MPIHWVTSAVVDRPIDEVCAVLLDFFNAPRIGRREGLLAIRQTSRGPIGVGSTYSERRVILGFETRLMARITEWDPPRRLGYRWHIAWDVALATDVELTFVDLGDDRTRLDVLHTGWDHFGEEADRFRTANSGGWGALLPAFATAAEA